MTNRFKDLVEGLDGDGLAELRRSVAAEMGERRQKDAILMEHIHPGMSDAQRESASKEIARVLRGEE
jgi:hypothetical protein